MQLSLDFGQERDLAAAHAILASTFGRLLLPVERLQPASQLVRSILGVRTHDIVSDAAYDRLMRHFSGLRELMTAPLLQIEAHIRDVTWPEDKAYRLVSALQIIENRHPDFDLGYLADLPVETALRELERLPGVGRKIAAAVLNFSTLAMPAFVVDTHVSRVLRRLGFIGRNASTQRAYYAVMEALGNPSALSLLELHVLLKKLGQDFCRATDRRCAACPLKTLCKMANRG